MYRVSERILVKSLNDPLVYGTDLMSSPAQKRLKCFISFSFCFWDTVTSGCRIPNAPLKTCNSPFWAAKTSIGQWYLERFVLLLPASEGCPSCPALAIALLLTLSLSTTASGLQLSCQARARALHVQTASKPNRTSCSQNKEEERPECPLLGCCCAGTGTAEGHFKLFLYRTERTSDPVFSRGRE